MSLTVDHVLLKNHLIYLSCQYLFQQPILASILCVSFLIFDVLMYAPAVSAVYHCLAAPALSLQC